MMPSVSGVRAKRQHHEVGAGQGVGVPVGLEHVVDAVEVVGGAPHDGDVAVERLQQPHERLGDAAATEDGDVGAEQVATLRRRPLAGPGVRAEAAHPGQRQGQGHLGHGLGVHALAARPLAVVVDEVDEVLDAGERQLHPAGVGGDVERLGEGVGVAGIGPDQAFGLGQRHDVAPTVTDRLGHPGRCAVGGEGDSRGLGSRHGQREASAAFVS